MKRIVVIDSFGCFFSSYYAMPKMNSPTGLPVSAIYGFCKDLFSIINDFNPYQVFCAFDLAGKGFRREIYPEYKKNRSETPVELTEQIPHIERVVEAFQIPILKCAGYEADDVIATVATKATGESPVIIVSSDKDCRQLLSDHVYLYNLRKREYYTVASLKVDWGITPEQCVDFQALCGDSSDNIPGARGIGQKTASELLQKYWTLEGIYENVGKVQGRRRDYLIAGKADAEISKQLVTLRKDVPVEISDVPYAGYDFDALMRLFHEFGFNSLMSYLQPPMLLNSPIPNAPVIARTMMTTNTTMPQTAQPLSIIPVTNAAGDSLPSVVPATPTQPEQVPLIKLPF